MTSPIEIQKKENPEDGEEAILIDVKNSPKVLDKNKTWVLRLSEASDEDLKNETTDGAKKSPKNETNIELQLLEAEIKQQQVKIKTLKEFQDEVSEWKSVHDAKSWKAPIQPVFQSRYPNSNMYTNPYSTARNSNFQRYSSTYPSYYTYSNVNPQCYSSQFNAYPSSYKPAYSSPPANMGNNNSSGNNNTMYGSHKNNAYMGPNLPASNHSYHNNRFLPVYGNVNNANYTGQQNRNNHNNNNNDNGQTYKHGGYKNNRPQSFSSKSFSQRKNDSKHKGKTKKTFNILIEKIEAEIPRKNMKIPNEIIVLIGPPASGKTTLSDSLNKALDYKNETIKIRQMSRTIQNRLKKFNIDVLFETLLKTLFNQDPSSGVIIQDMTSISCARILTLFCQYCQKLKEEFAAVPDIKFKICALDVNKNKALARMKDVDKYPEDLVEKVKLFDKCVKRIDMVVAHLQEFYTFNTISGNGSKSDIVKASFDELYNSNNGVTAVNEAVVDDKILTIRKQLELDDLKRIVIQHDKKPVYQTPILPVMDETQGDDQKNETTAATKVEQAPATNHSPEVEDIENASPLWSEKVVIIEEEKNVSANKNNEN